MPRGSTLCIVMISVCGFLSQPRVSQCDSVFNIFHLCVTYFPDSCDSLSRFLFNILLSLNHASGPLLLCHSIFLFCAVKLSSQRSFTMLCFKRSLWASELTFPGPVYERIELDELGIVCFVYSSRLMYF